MRAAGFICVLIGTVASAQPQPPEPVTQFRVSPAAPPVPALRWKLLPELRDTTPGNAAQLYYRAFAPEWMAQLHRDNSVTQSIRNAAALPFDQLKSPTDGTSSPMAWIRSSAMLKEVDRAARRQFCDWDLVTRVREDGIAMLLPDVQSLRVLASLIAVRARMELADGDFTQAIRSLQTGFALGRHVSDAPTLIQGLAGAAISGAILDQVEEWIRTPNSPNLYWALANLPQPFIDLRKPLEGEKILLDNLLPGFREALSARAIEPKTPAQIRSIREQLARMSSVGQLNVESALVVIKKYPAAKEFLLSQGWPANTVESLPALQVVLLAEIAQYDRLYDEMIKWYGLPYSQALNGLQRFDAALKKELSSSGSPSFTLAELLLPAITRVVEASYRFDRRIAALQVVEAVRIYAAESGTLPATLTDITQVPVPPDPATGNPFTYRLDGSTATLIAPPLPGTTGPRNSIKYEITIRK